MSTSALPASGATTAAGDDLDITAVGGTNGSTTTINTGGTKTSSFLGYATRVIPIVGFMRFGVAAWHRIRLSDCANPIPGETKVEGARSVQELKNGYNNVMWTSLAEAILPGVGTAISALRERKHHVSEVIINTDDAIGCATTCKVAYNQAIAGKLTSLFADEKSLRAAAK